MKEILFTEEMAEIARRTPATVRRWCREGKFSTGRRMGVADVSDLGGGEWTVEKREFYKKVMGVTLD